MIYKIAYISKANPKDDYIFKADFDTPDEAHNYIDHVNSNLSTAYLEIVSTEKSRTGKHEVSHN